MKFQEKLSTKQIQSIFLISVSLILFYSLRSKPEQSAEILFLFIFVMFGVSILNLFQESHKRYKILRSETIGDTGDYDSKAEKIVADYFKAKSIKFYLHPKVKVPKKIWIFDNPFSKRVLKPDFFLPQYNAFVEYWGMLDDENYKRKSELKKKAYRENDIDFISLTPRDLEERHRLDWNFTQKLLSLIRDREGNGLEWRK
ncbi:hypothetical protein HOE04_02090 [archaeon]|jgi:hypothetical protein|nr:hypothetical protein [archaeon]